MSAFKIGDLVCHKTNLEIKWAVYHIENGLAHCRRLGAVGNTMEAEFLVEELVLAK